MATGLYNNTFGYLLGSGGAAEDQNEAANEQEYICVEYLDRQCDIFVRWAVKNQLTTISRATAKLKLQQSTKHTLEDIELLLKHLEHSDKILLEKVIHLRLYFYK